MLRLIVILTLLATPAFSDEHDDQQGLDLMSEALKLFMRGLIQEMEPAMEGMEGLLEDLSVYHPPEILPNGDIIIRRRTPLESGSEDEEGEVEL